MSDQDWYSNKDLFEMFTGIKEEMGGLREEMKETRVLIKEYNGLRGRIDDIAQDVADLQHNSKIRTAFWTGIYKWVGWLAAIGVVVVTWLSLRH